jgi:hypothetical protein
LSSFFSSQENFFSRRFVESLSDFLFARCAEKKFSRRVVQKISAKKTFCRVENFEQTFRVSVWFEK